jgi:hypothetical protein
VGERQVRRVVTLVLRKIEHVIGDRRGVSVVTCSQNVPPCPCLLADKLGKISDLLGEDPDARARLDGLRQSSRLEKSVFSDADSINPERKSCELLLRLAPGQADLLS